MLCFLLSLVLRLSASHGVYYLNLDSTKGRVVHYLRWMALWVQGGWIWLNGQLAAPMCSRPVQIFELFVIWANVQICTELLCQLTKPPWRIPFLTIERQKHWRYSTQTKSVPYQCHDALALMWLGPQQLFNDCKWPVWNMDIYMLIHQNNSKYEESVIHLP